MKKPGEVQELAVLVAEMMQFFRLIEDRYRQLGHASRVSLVPGITMREADHRGQALARAYRRRLGAARLAFEVIDDHAFPQRPWGEHEPVQPERLHGQG